MTGQAEEVLREAGGEALVDFTKAALALVDATAPLIGAYVVGSIAAGDLRGAVSDLDLLLVTAASPARDRLLVMGERLADHADQRCPLRGLEAVLYAAATLASPDVSLHPLLNVNGGDHIPRRVATTGDPRFWFVLDVAAARQHAVTLTGPAITQVVGTVPHAVVLAALEESLVWHRRHAGPTPDAVLNACRALHWLETGRWLGKTDAGRWAGQQVGAALAPLVAAALDARARGNDDLLEKAPVPALLDLVHDRIRARRAS